MSEQYERPEDDSVTTDVEAVDVSGGPADADVVDAPDDVSGDAPADSASEEPVDSQPGAEVEAEAAESDETESEESESEAAESEAAESDDDDRPTRSPADRVKQLEAEGDIAADYLEELLDIADLDGDLDMDVEGDRAAVSIVGTGLDGLIGDEGKVLESLQELTRLAVYRETGERSRLMLDIGGYRADIRKNLVALAEDALEEVKETHEALKLAPMTPFERKIVHDAVAAAGLRSESEGVEPTRCVVILPAS